MAVPAVFRMPSRSDLTFANLTRSRIQVLQLSRTTIHIDRNKPSTLHTLSTLNTDETIMPLAKRVFMSSPHFAVLGASKDQSKVGTKVGFAVLSVDCMRFLNVIS